MSLIKKPFANYRLDKEKENDKRKIFTLSLNLEEYKNLQNAKKILRQAKDSTAIKQLAEIGRNVLLDNKTGLIIRYLFKNKENNTRMGIEDFKENFDKSNTNLTNSVTLSREEPRL